MNHRNTALFEIVLLIVGTFAFAYIIGETNSYFENGVHEESKFVKKSRELILDWFSRTKIGVVSAQEGGLWTCLEDVNGSICQEYPSDICNDVCTESCFPGEREDFAECVLGTCFDPTEGTCSANTPKFSCEGVGGEWTDSDEGVPAECNLGCCLLQGQTQWSTETTCNVIAAREGIEIDGEINKFDPTISNELECLFLAEQKEEGACVLEEIPEEGKFNCKFTTKADCLSLGGEFNKNLLCSRPDLNTICEKQTGVNCLDGEDGVYWFDSCGNRENIYESNKVRSWNSGEVLAKIDSCNSDESNAESSSCGNCNYFLGSICGEATGNKHIVHDELGDYICKDLSCVDEWGDFRHNGESWCAFDGQIGVDNENQANTERSVDVPGSRHYRRMCLDGEVRTEPCADFRGEVCVESRDDKVGFSGAACRINLWQACMSANTDEDKLNKCEENTDCTLHKVDFDTYFKFDVCTPKYPPGFDLKAELGGEVGEGVCSLASQKCIMVEVKKLFGGWKCEVNCHCKEVGFTETMNNLCISLGDCGGNVNVNGKYTDDGYSIKKAPRLDSGYVSGLKKYDDAKKNQFVEPLTGKELAALFGVPESTFENKAEFAEFLGKFGLGATGVVAGYVILAEGIPLSAFTYGSFLAAESATAPAFAPGGSSAGAFGNAALGAAAGAAIGFMVGKAFGLQGDALNLLVIVGAITGGIAGVLTFGSIGAAGTGATFSSFGAALVAFLFWVIVIVIIVALILELLGIGDVREIEIEFSCLPWQPPSGGKDCEKCDNDPLGCSRYKCNSLGQTCELVNEGTSDQLCIDINPNDASPPIINVNEDAIGEDFEYIDAQESVGTKIESTGSGDGCIQEYTPVRFGVSLNEPGQCKIEEIHTSNYNKMTNFFGGSNLYKTDHVTIEAMPTLISLGVPGIDPGRRGTYDLFVRCQDSSGNPNVQEYVINFCISPANDISPPVITEFIPESPAFAGFNVTDKFVQFYTNEPADCKWSLEDQDYEDMENVTICANDIEDVTPNGWLCGTVLPISEENETDYYFRCADQPWLLHDDDEENDGDRNINTESMVYTLVKSSSELEISFVSPNNEMIIVGGDPVSVDLEAHTGGGANGNAFCEYSFNGDLFIDFFETGGNVHLQTFTNLFAGDYDISLMCVDIADNVATGSSVFSIEIDNVGPEITRVYNQGGTLHVVTNEPSECASDLSSCGFNFENGTLMSGNGLDHTTPFEQGLIYHIKCRDDFGNVGSCLVATGGY